MAATIWALLGEVPPSFGNELTETLLAVLNSALARLS